jgi:integrase
LNPNNLLRNFYVIQKRAAARAEEDNAPLMPAFSIHDLRHTHATHLLQEGWPVPTVSRRLGHANPGITLTIYTHALSDVQGEDVKTPAAFAFAGTA